MSGGFIEKPLFSWHLIEKAHSLGARIMRQPADMQSDGLFNPYGFASLPFDKFAINCLSVPSLWA